MNVRFEGNNGRDAAVKRCLLMTIADIPAFASFHVTTILPSGAGRPATKNALFGLLVGVASPNALKRSL